MSKQYGRIVRDPPIGSIRQEWGRIEPNPLRLGTDDAEQLVDALGVDFAGSFNLFYLLRKRFWTAEGAEHEEVADFLREAYGRVREINDELAIRTVQLGGLPPTTPPTIQARSAVHLEAEDLFDLRASLTGDLTGYAALIESMREHVGLAEGIGDRATARLLRRHLEALEADARHVGQLLEADSLVGGSDRHVRDEDGDEPGLGDERQADASHLRSPGPSHLRREWGSVGGNELRLGEGVATRLVEALNDDLSGLYIVFNQIRKHAWLAEGRESTLVRQFLEDTARGLTGTTDEVAIRVHALGGVPVSGPMGLRQHASLYIESPHQYDLRSSLERDLDGLATLVEQLREHVGLASDCGDGATAELLAELLLWIERAVRTMDKYLADETLVRSDERGSQPAATGRR